MYIMLQRCKDNFNTLSCIQRCGIDKPISMVLLGSISIALHLQVVQNQTQALVIPSGPGTKEIDLRDNEVRSVRTVNSKRSRT